MDLNDAIAELQGKGDWFADEFEDFDERLRSPLATILNAVLSGQLIPLETCNARVAAVVREAAGVDFPKDWRDAAHAVHDRKGILKAQATWSAGFNACRDAIRALTPADHTAALDAMISRARGVKPLVFEPVPSEDALCHDHWSAPALGGAYHMAPDEDSPGTWLLQWTIRADDFCMKYGGAITRHSSPEDVHSAAQADYTASIHVALRANATDASEGER